MEKEHQIFQAESPTRWKRIKWTGRIILVIAIFIIAAVVLAVAVSSNPSTVIATGVFTGEKDSANNPYKKIKGFKDFLEKKQREDSLSKLSKNAKKEESSFLRCAFYTPWSGSKSINSLEKYGDKLSVVFPEWFFIDTNGRDKIQLRIDSLGLAQMRQKKLRIMPMLTNFNSSTKDFDGDLIHPILTNSRIQQAFIQNLVDTLTKYNFSGINIDFEELKEPSNKPLSVFQKNLYTQLHANGFVVTQDVAVNDNDYNFKELINYNDYVILMAYDEHSNVQSGSGSISSQQWIENALDIAATKMESSKIILGLAGYGYDWYEGFDDDGNIITKIKNITYAEAIDNANISKATINFDNNTYNLHYSYTEKTIDTKGHQFKHDVYFTDAATTFNIMRFADEYGLAGTALWRLGSEDPRIWSFYNRDLSNDALNTKPFNFNSLATIPINPNQKPTAVGQAGGEILNILSSPQEGKIQFELDSTERLIAEQFYTQLPSGYVYEKSGEDPSPIGPGHKIILTFDDGPSEKYTPMILSILEREKVPATFFVVGLEAEKNLSLLQRIYRDGYEIGNHTFTHHNIATMSPGRADIELKATRLLIEAATGHSTILFRAPYNADSEPQTFEEIEPLARSKKDNYITVGESIDPNDWDAHNPADSIVAKTIRQAEERNANIILLHDAGGESRQATVDALPRIIQYFKSKGCTFTTVANLMGKTKDDVMPVAKHDWKTGTSFMFAKTTYWLTNFIFSLFLIGIFLSVARICCIALLAWIQKRKESKQAVVIPFTPKTSLPLVSIIVPAYNEEVNAERTVQSLLQQNYPNLEIVFVDDGSKDATYSRVSNAFQDVDNVYVHTKFNGGKASALNFGIAHASGEFVVCIDADTQLKKDAVSQLMKKFTGPEVGAVAGNVKVGNEINMITKWQSIEYITSQNFDRRAFDYLNCITVVPGAIGAFKKEAVLHAGGFTTDTLAEDCDLTMRLHKCGYDVKNCTEAISYTEAPETMKQFMKQRFRWSFGVMQSFWKHRGALFNPRYKNFGMIALPHILIFQMILPFLAPIADLVLIISLALAAANIIPLSTGHILLYYVIFSLVDIAGAALAFAYEKEDYKKLVWMIPQRFIYRQLMYYILFKSFNKALKGELQGWGVLKRTGSVKQLTSV
ncbi:glycosyltransferase [Ferruginibacter lapsinanis]|uniref:glycosyltransferase n=1 Tax=Ferruginibacter lapsinanis TaxID=563172 RepID=UPI001E28A267|nr:glycosyltransferase [Ferruginibacter lapsinanis]UEG50955.1 glycosyltransferase [Ferruginibacter lapsinanis]